MSSELLPSDSLALHRPGLLAAAVLLASAPSSSAQNLLTNPGFEAGLSGWTTVSSAPEVRSYGAAGTPGPQVAQIIGAGNRLLTDLGGGGTTIEQVVVTGPLGPGEHVEASGYFGGLGNSPDFATLTLRFLDGSGQELGRRDVGSVTAEARNQESVLMFRRGLFVPPAGTEQLAARVVFANPCCGGSDALADELFVSITSESLVPPPLPLNQNLLANSTFEEGWAPGSPLTLSREGDWRGTRGRTRVQLYSNSSPFVPSLGVSSVVGGDAALLRDAGDGGLQQILDLRGNAGQIAAGLDLLVSCFEGGYASSDDTVRLDVQFLNEFFVPVGAPAPPVGPVTRAMRNGETVVMKRERRYAITPGAAYVSIAIAFSNSCCGDAHGMIDNISASLVSPTSPAPLPLLVNVVENGSFEAGSLPGSPLQLDSASSWVGASNGRVTVSSYGGSSEVPDPAFSQMNGLGGLVLDDLTGNGALAQTFDLRGMQSIISQGSLMVSASVWLGGFSTQLDHAAATIQFLNEAQVQVGLLRELGPVTAADRMNQTTLLREAETFVVPLGTAYLKLTLSMSDFCCGAHYGLADGIELMFSDGSTFGTRYCTANVNSTGVAASVAALGSDVLAMNSLTLAAGGLPAQAFAFFITSRTQGFVANPAGSAGNLCLGGAIGRYVGPNQIQQANGVGNISLDINLNSIPAPQGPVAGVVGDTWNFQAWYRDSLGSGTTSNFTDGVEVILR
ncbi:MAG: hypothetical protein AAGG01_14545 [Planctomycetota bacterium]